MSASNDEVDGDQFPDLVSEFETVFASGQANYAGCRRPVSTKLNIPLWRELLGDYAEDTQLCDMSEFGFPLDVQGDISVNTQYRNHKGARVFPEFIGTYLKKR